MRCTILVLQIRKQKLKQAESYRFPLAMQQNLTPDTSYSKTKLLMERMEEILKSRDPWICISTGLETEIGKTNNTLHTAVLPRDAPYMADVLLSLQRATREHLRTHPKLCLHNILQFSMTVHKELYFILPTSKVGDKW